MGYCSKAGGRDDLLAVNLRQRQHLSAKKDRARPWTAVLSSGFNWSDLCRVLRNTRDPEVCASSVSASRVDMILPAADHIMAFAGSASEPTPAHNRNNKMQIACPRQLLRDSTCNVKSIFYIRNLLVYYADPKLDFRFEDCPSANYNPHPRLSNQAQPGRPSGSHIHLGGETRTAGNH